MLLEKAKHTSFNNRLDIEKGLSLGMSFKAIAKHIGKDPTTVSKEVKRHITTHVNSFVSCDDVCPNLLKPPFVCNGCKKKSSSSCHYTRHFYRAKEAQIAYESTLVESRTGVTLNKDSFYHDDKIVSECVLKGQHINHIIHSNTLSCSRSSIYLYIKRGYFQISPLDLPRMVKFKTRAPKNSETIPKHLKIGRMYEDFLNFMAFNPAAKVAEMDTVIGRIGGKTLITFIFTPCNFMFGLLLENKTSLEVSKKVKQLKEKLHNNGFYFEQIMPILLTDNGGEFSCIDVLENSDFCELKTKVFFCEPRSPEEKPRVEKNHTMLRDIFPKGESFDDLTQENINLIFSHINSVKRDKFNGKSSYELFTFLHSRKLASILGVEEIPASEVIQSTKLLKMIRKS